MVKAGVGEVTVVVVTVVTAVMGSVLVVIIVKEMVVLNIVRCWGNIMSCHVFSIFMCVCVF